MIKFKQYFTEQATNTPNLSDPPVGYNYPTSRTKFDYGDIVVVLPTGNWNTYQSKRSFKYFNQAGYIVGHKLVPGAYTKFAVQFSDGVVEAFHGHFLFGPFKDFKSAEKYKDKPIDDIYIDASDYKPDPKKRLLEPQRNEKFELKIQKLVTSDPFNFTWLEQPIEYISKEAKLTLLAYKPKNTDPLYKIFLKNGLKTIHEIFSNQDIFEEEKAANIQYEDKTVEGWGSITGTVQDEKAKQFFDKNFVVIRCNHLKTNKLYNAGTLGNITEAFSKSDELYGFRGKSPYIITCAGMDSGDRELLDTYYKFNKKTMPRSDRGVLGCFSLNSDSIRKQGDIIAGYNNMIKLFTSEFDRETTFDLTHNVKRDRYNNKIIEGNGNAYSNRRVMLSDINWEDFQGMYIKLMDVVYVTTTGIINIPNLIDCKLTIIGKDKGTDITKLEKLKLFNHTPSNTMPTIKDFDFIQKNISGGASSLYFTTVKINDLSLINPPSDLKELNISKCNLTTLKGLPDMPKTSLDVSSNLLTTFEGGPKKVYKFNAINNDVKSLKGLPYATQLSNDFSNLFSVYRLDNDFSFEEIVNYLKNKRAFEHTSDEVEASFDDFVSNL